MRFQKKTAFALGLLLVGCATKRAEEPPILRAPPRHPAIETSAAPIPGLTIAPIARVPEGTFGPYLGMNERGGVAVWASVSAGARAWFSRVLSGAGQAVAAAVSLGDAPSELGLVTVRALPGGFALLSTHKVSDGEVVEVALLSDAGVKIAGPTSVGRSTGSMLWVEAIPKVRGAAVLWAASSAGHAEIWGAEIDEKAELRSPPRVFSRDAGAWQAVPFGQGFALGVTHVGKGSGAHGPIDVTLVTGPDAPLSPIVVNGEASADLDLDLASLGEQLVLAWSDHRGGENRVFSCALDHAGAITAAAGPATPPLGEQAALRVVAPAGGSARGYLAWEALDAQTADHRSFQVAAFEANGRVSSTRGSFDYWKMDGSMPEIAASEHGVSVLTLAPVCDRGAACPRTAPIAPVFIEFDARFAVQSSEPVWAESAPAPATLAWNLTCPNSLCFALSAGSGTPSAVGLARLEHRSDHYSPSAERVELPPPPRVMGDEALAETEPLSQIAVADTKGGTLLGWVTDFDPTTPWVKLKKPSADGRREPLRARLDLRAFAKSEPFAALSDTENLSLRAHSLGGLALTSDARKGEALVTWAGIDNGQPQVFLSLVEPSGKKLVQRMLTHKTGELNDLATLADGADYFVGWVDERNADPEVYATKVNHQLNRIAPEQRITQAAGAATDLSLVATRSGPLAVWADTRDSEQAGSANIYSAALRSSDAGRLAPEVCVEKTRAHSFAPIARAHGNTTLVAWLEARVDTGAESPAHLSFAELDDTGHVLGSVQNVTLGSATPVTLGLDCAEHVCHALVSVDEAAHSALYAVSFADGKPSPAVRVRSSSGAPSSVAPVVHGDDAYVTEVQQGRAHLRRLRLDW